MSYMWNNFNIKTFPAETIVYRDGYYQEQFSTLPEQDFILNKYDLPIHIIYVGRIERDNVLNINLMAASQPVFLTVDIENNLPAFLNIFIKNAGKNSEIRGHILCKNSSDLAVKIVAEHDAPENAILVQTKVICKKDSYSLLSGTTYINQNCVGVRSDIQFAGYATDSSAKIKFIPSQRILATPEYADHSAYMFNVKPDTENYLRTCGLSGAEVKNAMIEAFKNDFNLF